MKWSCRTTSTDSTPGNLATRRRMSLPIRPANIAGHKGDVRWKWTVTPSTSIDLVQESELGDRGPHLRVLDPAGRPTDERRVDHGHRDSVPATPVSTAGASAR